jgi:hypothetical protein
MASFSAARKQGQASVPFKLPPKSGNSIKSGLPQKKGKIIFKPWQRKRFFFIKENISKGVDKTGAVLYNKTVSFLTARRIKPRRGTRQNSLKS